MLIIKDILFHRRKYFIEVKALLMESILSLNKRTRLNTLINTFLIIREIIRLSKLYPEPAKKDVVWKNTHKLIDAFARIKQYHNNRGRQPLIEAAGRVIIDQYEHDGYYAFLFDYLMADLIKNGWESENRGFPMWRYWNGPLLKDNNIETNPDWLRERMSRKLGVI